ncbi:MULTISPECIES: hypothetical protein [unclassified Variovorax]|uniref:hypothetical protein n=1 Tax=unclassified Variovorax TaxID=663243 RepID=UPI000F7D9FAD|nr:MULTISPECIES: hypothetical protein [unclassified Variovorax]RSZ35992.1 hypothetical protein EJO70_23125 [Variovorax sp. 553]RSZ36851.1 hypothetical protein EJO71_24345 [Variovorax sp. 679]
MKKTDVLVTVMGMARSGLGFTPTDALACISDLIEQEDPQNPFHDANVERLLRLGACIWSMKHGMLAQPSSENFLRAGLK